jgi:hypothetical protein
MSGLPQGKDRRVPSPVSAPCTQAARDSDTSTAAPSATRRVRSSSSRGISGYLRYFSVGLRWCFTAIAFSSCVPHVIWTGRDPARHLRAEILAEGGSQWLRTGDVQGERFDAVGTDGIAFAPNGTALAYPALRAGKWFMISGPTTLGPFDSIADPRFSPDSSRLAFIAQSPAGFHAVVDGLPSRAFEHIQPGTLQFSRNSAHLGFVGHSNACASIVVDGLETPCRERVLSLRITDSGKAAAVIREQRSERFLFEEPGPPFDEIPEWTTSESGRIAYAARSGSRSVVVLDGVASSPCDRVRSLRFGDNGQRVAWICLEKDLSSLVVDGTPGPAFPSISSPVLASRSPAFAYLARDAKGAWVVFGESKLGPYSHAVDLVVSRNGQGLAFVARSKGLTRIVHNGRETPVDAVIEASLVLSDDGLHWAALTGVAATQALSLTIDGAPRRRVVASEVFGDPSAHFSPWLERELRLAVAGAP